jgi:hypothetical protein
MAHELFNFGAPADPALQQDYQLWLTSTKEKAKFPPLTAEEKTRPYAKFFRDMVPADPAHLALFEQPCDPAQALYPDQINRLLNPGYLEVESGWCVLPNGAGFVADHNRYEGMTAEMIDWWFAWHCLEDARYRIWNPQQHAGVMVSSAARKQILDPSIPMREKYWGITHHVTEDAGAGTENINICFLSPKDFGFDMQRFQEPTITTFVGGYGWSCPVDNSQGLPPGPALMCHTFRNVPGGVEERTRFWIGYGFENGQPKLMLPPGVRIPAEAVQGLAYHSTREFKNLSSFLPELYKTYKGEVA